MRTYIFVAMLLCGYVNAIFPQRVYVPGAMLLLKDGNYPYWGQSENNDGDCNPSYNYYCPSGFSGDPCDRTAVGCAAVALGQVMYRWNWPYLSSYRLVDWDKMPAKLKNGDPTDLPRLLRDIGTACDTHYEEFLGVHDWKLVDEIDNSWTLWEDIRDGMEGKFKYDISIWDRDELANYGDAWEDLLRSEISCGRPVVIYGQSNGAIDGITSAHYYVLDGYHETDNRRFHYNSGWGHGRTKNVDWRLFPDIKHHVNPKAILVSPRYPKMEERVTSHGSSTIGGLTEIDAKRSISLPSSGGSLTVKKGATLVLVAGESISLKSGFVAEPGATVRAIINPVYKEEMEISCQLQRKWITKKCAGSDYDKVRYSVKNATLGYLRFTTERARCFGRRPEWWRAVSQPSGMPLPNLRSRSAILIG